MISLFLGGVSWKKNDVHAARWLSVMFGSIALWTTMQAASALSQDIGEKLFYHDLMYIGISMIPISVLYFVLDYYHILKKLNPTIKYSLPAIPLMTICVVATDPYHHLFYKNVQLQTIGEFGLIYGTFNMWFWVHSAYSYLLVIGTLLILGYQLQNESGQYRRQSVHLIAAILASSAINLLTITKIIALKVDMTPFTFVLVGAVFYTSLFYTRVFEIGPITKDLLYNNIHDSLLILDTSGAVTEHNQGFLELFDSIPDKIIGMNAVDLFDSLGYCGEQAMKDLNTSMRFRTENNRIPVNWQITRKILTGRNSSQSGILYLFKDVTEIDESLSAADHALKAAEKAKESITRYLSDMSHEIRTPLMGIMGAANQLQTDACDDEQRSDADEILRGAEDLLETVNRILDYSKLEAGKMNAYDGLFTLENYFSRLSSLCPPEILIASDPGIRDLSLKGDYEHLSQLMNLIHCFLQECGTEELFINVAFDGKKLSHALSFSITLPEAQELLMEWDHLEDYLMKPWHPDPLNLVLADKVSKFLGAPISLKSLGSKWDLEFSLDLETVTVAVPKPGKVAVSPDTPFKLLFAEDSIINQAVIQRMFKTFPWELTFASDGNQALEIAQSSVFDGIFTDIHMPGLGGIELSHRLSETINRDTPVFALTSDTDAELQARIKESPIRALIVKPFPKESLIRLLQENQPIVLHDDDLS